MEKKDNKVIKKVNNLYNDLNIKEQSKDLRNNFKTTERSIKPISDSDFDIDHLKKLLIVFKPFNLRMKILENAFYIVIKSSIYIYSRDL